ncbi:MAG: hypothetical protein Q7T93_01805 [Methylobacterium sp.]|uniref:hypothetical protein n=1 Tax=Methylobacterium sp. TaxID=409 RepID=UPI002727A14A|nr:hypothetical protein [Methylobacterium sp.]MDO9425546.1 hypothetical protein [Methylobacterium sp.]
MPDHALTYATDLDGTSVVGVIMPKTAKTVWLDAVDYDFITALHPNARWSNNPNGFGQHYVRLRIPGDTNRNLYVARIITGNLYASGTRYHDGDRSNLRRSNLFTGIGSGGVPKKARKRRVNPLHIPMDGVRSHA